METRNNERRRKREKSIKERKNMEEGVNEMLKREDRTRQNTEEGREGS